MLSISGCHTNSCTNTLASSYYYILLGCNNCLKFREGHPTWAMTFCNHCSLTMSFLKLILQYIHIPPLYEKDNAIKCSVSKSNTPDGISACRKKSILPLPLPGGWPLISGVVGMMSNVSLKLRFLNPPLLYKVQSSKFIHL